MVPEAHGERRGSASNGERHARLEGSAWCSGPVTPGDRAGLRGTSRPRAERTGVRLPGGTFSCRFAWAWFIGAVLVLGLPACGGVPIPDICLDPKPCQEAVCRAGRWEGCEPPAPGCTCEADGTWKCPPPPPPTVRFPELLLKRDGPRFVDAQGQPFALLYHASCCFWEADEVHPVWSLASNEHLDRVKALGFNLVHWRLGPWRPQPDFPAPIREMGGPY